MHSSEESFLSEEEIRAMSRDIDLTPHSTMVEEPTTVTFPTWEFDAKLSYFMNKLTGTHRRKHNCDKALILFSSMTKNCKAPKKEYIRVMLIRGHKNMLRHAIKATLPTRKLIKLDHSNNKISGMWKALKELCLNPELSRIALTETGPLTDGKGRRNKKREKTQRTFNDEFCKSYFESEIVRKSWDLFIELLFCNASCDLLSEKFGFSCCKGFHSIDCNMKWELMKVYLQIEILESLGIPSCHADDLVYQELDIYDEEKIGML